MPEAQRQEFTVTTAKGPVRAMLHTATGAAGRRPGVVLHRGIPSADEKAGDLLEVIANALSEAGIAAIRFEPRASSLILADFNSYSLSDEIGDLTAVLTAAGQNEAIDPARLGLLAFGLGAIAAVAAARQTPSLEHLCLIAPADAAFVSRTAKANTANNGSANGTAAALHTEQLPDAWVAAAAQADPAQDAAACPQPMLIVHGAGDRFIEPTHSRPYAAAREAAKLPGERVLVARADHTFSHPAARQTCIERIVRFLTDRSLPKQAAQTVAGADV